MDTLPTVATHLGYNLFWIKTSKDSRRASVCLPVCLGLSPYVELLICLSNNFCLVIFFNMWVCVKSRFLYLYAFKKSEVENATIRVAAADLNGHTWTKSQVIRSVNIVLSAKYWQLQYSPPANFNLSLFLDKCPTINTLPAKEKGCFHWDIVFPNVIISLEHCW